MCRLPNRILLPAAILYAGSLFATSLPPGLTAAAWRSIQQEYQRNRHAAVPLAGGEWRAYNSEQRWDTLFDGRGFAVTPDEDGWRWGLALRSYGFPGTERWATGRARLSQEAGRLRYQWDQNCEEWFINDGHGLEHGFTIARPPLRGGGGPLQVRLAVLGGLRAVGSGKAIRFVDASGRAVVNYAGLKAIDADGRELAARMWVEGLELQIDIEDSGAAYPITIDPTVQQASLKASVATPGDVFGSAIAVSGDTAVVAAEGYNSHGVNGAAGAVYVFVRNGTAWSQQAFIQSANTVIGDAFGTSVAISGDTIVVGALAESSSATGINGDPSVRGATHSGAAYVFVRSGTTWTQQAYLKASNTDSFDNFGCSVGIDGDTIVVGAQGESSKATGVNGNQSDNSAGSSGAAYVFIRSGTTWTQQAYLKASNTEASDLLGWSAAISGTRSCWGRSVKIACRQE